MWTLETIAANPDCMLVVAVVYALGCRVLRCATWMYQERAHTRRIEAAVRDTRSKDRGGVVRACGALQSRPVAGKRR